MTFTVIWLPFAFDEMQELIQASPERRSEFASALTELNANSAPTRKRKVSRVSRPTASVFSGV